MPSPIVARLAAVSAAAVLTAGGVGVALYQHAAAAPTAQAATSAASTSTTSTAAATTNAATSGRRAGGAAQPFKTVLDGLVQQGKISATQEQEILSAFQQYAQTHKRGGGPGRVGFGLLFGDEEQAIAKALGLTTQQLRADLRSGKSINAIAAAQKVDPATVQAAAVSAARTDLDKAVQAGKLSQAQETKILDALPGQLQKLFAATPGQKGGFGKPFQGQGGAPGRRPAPSGQSAGSVQ